MIGHKDGFSPKVVTLLGAGDKHDVVADAKSEFSMTIHQRSDGQISHSKQCSTLTHMTAIQMLNRHSHLCHSMLFIHLCNLTSSICRETVCTIQ